MESIIAFAEGLMHFVLQGVALIINFFIYILSFLVSLLQQLLSAVV